VPQIASHHSLGDERKGVVLVTSTSAFRASVPAVAAHIPEGPNRAETELLIICARARLEPPDQARVDELLRGGLDWAELFRTAGMHGMLPLLYTHIAEVPERFKTYPHIWDLQDFYRRNAGRTLKLTGTLLGILRMFAAENIVGVPYKGPPLAARIYGNVARRQAGDLDILLRKSDVPRARDLLLSNGFTLRYPDTPGTRAFRFASRYSEELIAPDSVHIELHWAFANRDVPFTLTLEDMLPRLETVSVGGPSVPCFAAEDLLLVLCVHGAKHRWDRLEWIAGVGEMLRSMDIDWDAAFSRAEEFRTRRTMLLGLSLAHELLEAPLPPDVLRQVKAERWIATLTNDVRVRVLSAGSGDGAREGGVLSRNLFQFPLQQSTREQLRYLGYRLTTPNRPDSWRTVTVGARSMPVHALTWPLRLGAKLATLPFRSGTKKR